MQNGTNSYGRGTNLTKLHYFYLLFNPAIAILKIYRDNTPQNNMRTHYGTRLFIAIIPK